MPTLSVESEVVICLILFGFVLAWRVLLKAWFRLRREAAEVRLLQSQTWPVTQDAMRRQLEESLDLDTTRLLRVALNTGNADVETLSLYDRIHWSRYWAGMFVFPGLLGTVWGVSVAIFHLTGTLTASSPPRKRCRQFAAGQPDSAAAVAGTQKQHQRTIGGYQVGLLLHPRRHCGYLPCFHRQRLLHPQSTAGGA